MYVHFLLGLGGWVGAPDDAESADAEAANPPADLPQPAREPRPGCFSGRAPHRCCRWRTPGLRT